MSADLERRATNLPVEYVSERPMRLVEWAEEARAANHLAQALCKTAFAGAYRDNPDGATAAILKGAEVGLTPVTSLGAFDLIQGTPAPKALTLRALVQAHGHRVWIESSNDTSCTAKAIRRGETEVHESRWTIARAKAMDLTGKANWKKQPAAMLIARATAEVCRMVAADVILGIGYSSEEVQDTVTEPQTTVRRGATAKTTAQRALPRPPEPQLDEPEPDFDPPTNTSAPEATSPASDAEALIDPKGDQMKALHASLNDAGMPDRTAGLAFISDVLDKQVESTKDLTVPEASRVLDELKSLVEHE